MQHAAAAHAHQEEHHTSTGLDNRKLLMWAFLGSDCLFFGTLIGTYLLYRGKSLTGPYPSWVFDIPYTSVSAFVLLMSSVTMVLALAAVQRNDLRRMRIWLMATSLLGLTFVGGQAYEFSVFFTWHAQSGESMPLLPWTNLFGSSFFILTGLHGTHVTIGVLWLLSLWASSLRGHVTQENALDVEIAGLYWHFVDIVWIVIFTVIYLVPDPSGGPPPGMSGGGGAPPAH